MRWIAGFAFTFLPLVLAAEETAAPAKGMQLAFSEDFEQGMDRWEPTDPAAWALVEDGGSKVLALQKSSAYEPAVRSPKSIAWLKDFNAASFVLEVRARQTGREYGHRDLCFFFGRQDATHYYYVHIATAADDHANSIFLVNGAPRVSIAKERTSGTKWTSDYHRIRIVRDAENGRIEVFFDDMDTPIMMAEDKTFTSGTIGLGSFDDTGNFDDIRVWTK
jgi:hypothetical protein